MNSDSIIPFRVLRARAEVGFGVAEKDLFEDFVFIPFALPVEEQLLIFENREVATEHNPVLQSATDFLLQRWRELPGTPTMQLVANVPLMKQNSNHILLPRVGGAGCENFKLRIASGDAIDVTRVTIIEKVTFATR